MKRYLYVGFMILVFLAACKNANDFITITPSPVFSEVDTFELYLHKLPFSKHDYFLVSGDIKDKQALKAAIDSFSRINFSKECGKYDNYTMFFYKRSSQVDERSIQSRDSMYRYRIFLYNKDEDFIGSFDCWNAFPRNGVQYQPKYQQ